MAQPQTEAKTDPNGRKANGSGGALAPRNVVDQVGQHLQSLIGAGELHLPPNYSAENALKAAWLKLQNVVDRNKKPALQVCSKHSIANALLDMVIQGLNPAKDQCYFLVYGDTLVCMRSYIGTVALLRRVYGQEAEVWSEVVYEGDEFEYEIDRGRKRIVKHVQRLQNVDAAKILAAYAVVEPGGDRPSHTEIMTREQILKAWQQGQTKGDSPAHKNFSSEMSRKTVINRACKVLIKASDDAHLVMVVERQAALAAEAEMEAEVAEHANRELIGFTDDGIDSAGVVDVEVEDDAPEREPGEDDEPKAVEDGSPTARFLALIQHQELDPTHARRVAAQIANVDDVRRLGNAELAPIVSDPEAFLEAYHGKPAGEDGQKPLQGPGW